MIRNLKIKMLSLLGFTSFFIPECSIFVEYKVLSSEEVPKNTSPSAIHVQKGLAVKLMYNTPFFTNEFIPEDKFYLISRIESHPKGTLALLRNNDAIIMKLTLT